MDALLQDVRYGLRQLARSPLFSFAAIATLALGIGANTALFSLGKAILVKALPGVVQSDRLVWVMPASRGGRPASTSWPDFQEYRAGLAGLVDLATQSDGQFSLSSRGEPERLRGQIVSGNYFAVLRTPFALGRGFAPDEDSVGAPKPVAVVSYDLWQTRLNGDSSAIGQAIVVNGQPFTIVGVTARGFNGADLELPRYLWLPVAMHDVARPEFSGNINRRGEWWLAPIGRLKPGASRERVESAASTIAARLAAADTSRDLGYTRARVYSARSGLPPGSEREVMPLTILSAVVTGLVLLIACANVSNLLLARAVTRRREVGIRLSIGATRARLVRQLLTESVLLALAASVTGVLLAYWCTDWLLASGVFPLQLDVRPDTEVIAFAVAAAAVAAILFGIVPAVDATRADLAASVKSEGQGRDPRRSRLQSAFVVTQLSLSLVLLTTAGLFLRSMYKAQHVEIGYDASPQVLAMSFDLGLQRYSDARTSAFIQSLTESTRGMPGVQQVSFTDVPPMGNRYIIGELTIEGQRQPPVVREGGNNQSVVNQPSIRPGYFDALGMRIVRGRDFTARDDPSSTPVIILSDATARALWPGAEALGQRVSLGGERGPFRTVVGIASDVMLGGPTEAKYATAYVPQLQNPGIKGLTLLVRTVGEPGPLAEALRREFRRHDANLPVFNVHTLAEYKQLKLADRMNGAAILAGFGALALLLASIGVYGVMAFSVVQRTREIGIRIALGARSSDVTALFVARGMRLTVIGVAIGVLLSLAASQLLQGMLFGLTPTDGATFAGVALILAGVALLASWLPSRRAAAVDPVNALRAE